MVEKKGKEKTPVVSGEKKEKGGEVKAKVTRRSSPPKKKIVEKREIRTPKAKAEQRRRPIRKKKPEKVEVKPEPKPRPKPTEPVAPPVALAEAEEKEYSPEEYQQMMTMYEETLQNVTEGELVQGKILSVTKEDVIVDVGFKSEGIIPLSEFTGPLNIQVGDQIEVFLEAIEDQDGQLVLSKQKADFIRVWDKIKEAQEGGTLVDGKLLRRIKGGIVVDVFGVDAFLPGSQIALRQVPDFDALLGQTMQLKIIKLNKARRNIVVSRRVVLEEEREEQRQKLLVEIEPGQIREGVVKNITDFGVFIDLGGVDGLLHITDMSWGRISHPSELVAFGDELPVKILDFDKNTGRISLGMKQLSPYPWENIEEKYPLGKKVKGRVVSVTDYGAFVELEKGIEGLIHISEMSWTQHIKHPSRLVAIQDMVEAVVLSVDKENEKISLGIKQLEPDPWETLDEKYPVGSRVVGKVRNLTTFGVFIELEEGIDGLVHISDMSWTKRVQHPSEIMRKNDRVEVVVLSIDKENRRVSLGYKQTREDPWPELSKKFARGAETKGKILRLLDRGVIVDLGEGVEGFVPTKELGKPDISKPIQAFEEKDEIPLNVIEFDQLSKRIVLSVNAYYQGREKLELDEYRALHPIKSIKVEDMVKEVPKVSPEPQPEKKEETTPQPEVSESEPETEQKPPEPSVETQTEELPKEQPAEREKTTPPESSSESEEKKEQSEESGSEPPDPERES